MKCSNGFQHFLFFHSPLYLIHTLQLNWNVLVQRISLVLSSLTLIDVNHLKIVKIEFEGGRYHNH